MEWTATLKQYQCHYQTHQIPAHRITEVPQEDERRQI